MEFWAIEAYKYAVVNGAPLRVLLLALKAKPIKFLKIWPVQLREIIPGVIILDLAGFLVILSQKFGLFFFLRFFVKETHIHVDLCCTEITNLSKKIGGVFKRFVFLMVDYALVVLLIFTTTHYTFIFPKKCITLRVGILDHSLSPSVSTRKGLVTSEWGLCVCIYEAVPVRFRSLLCVVKVVLAAVYWWAIRRTTIVQRFRYCKRI